MVDDAASTGTTCGERSLPLVHYVVDDVEKQRSRPRQEDADVIGGLGQQVAAVGRRVGQQVAAADLLHRRAVGPNKVLTQTRRVTSYHVITRVTTRVYDAVNDVAGLDTQPK